MDEAGKEGEGFGEIDVDADVKSLQRRVSKDRVASFMAE
jgi:hypothetical protein